MGEMYYIFRDGKQEGPLTLAEIDDLQYSGSVSDATPAWKQGTAEWGLLGNVRNAPPGVEQPLAFASSATAGSLGGIGRLGYIGMYGLVWILISSLSFVGQPWRGVLGILVLIVLSSTAIVLRLKNIGYSRWFVVLAFVPLIGMVVSLPCLFLPPSYAQTKSLDRPAQIIIGIMLGVVTAIVALCIYSIF